MHKNIEKKLETYIGWFMPFINLAASNSGDENLVKDCEHGNPYENLARRICHNVCYSIDTVSIDIIRPILLAFFQGCDAFVGEKDITLKEVVTKAAGKLYPRYREWSAQLYREYLADCSSGTTPTLSFLTPENAGYGFIMADIHAGVKDAAGALADEVSKKAEVRIWREMCLKVTTKKENLPFILKSVYQSLGDAYDEFGNTKLKRRVYIVETGDFSPSGTFGEMMDATETSRIFS